MVSVSEIFNLGRHLKVWVNFFKCSIFIALRSIQVKKCLAVCFAFAAVTAVWIHSHRPGNATAFPNRCMLIVKICP